MSAHGATIESTRWRADPGQTRIEFVVPNCYGLMSVRGRFDRFEGSLDLGAVPAIDLTIQAASVRTGIGLRDRHLRAGHFFDAKRHPAVRFVSEKVVLEDNRLQITGSLSAAGRSAPLAFDATVQQVGDQLRVEAVTTVDQRTLGMNYSLLGSIGAPASLRVSASLVPAS